MRVKSCRVYASGSIIVGGRRHQRALELEADIESTDTDADVTAELQRRVDAWLQEWLDGLRAN